MEYFQQFIKQFPGYSDEAYQAVTPFLTPRHLNAGDYFLQEGQYCRQLAFVEKGMVRLFYLQDGKEVTNCFCRENTITTSYLSLVSDTPSEYAIQAIEETHLLVLAYDKLKMLFDKFPFWQQVGRMAIEQEYLDTQCHFKRLSDLSATERYQYILHHQPDLIQRVPLNYLASYLQITPETLSRVRKRISGN